MKAIIGSHYLHPKEIFSEQKLLFISSYRLKKNL